MADKKWQDATLEERQAVVDCYNKYYDNVNEPIDLATADAYWTDNRWITIKYTFGIKPTWA